jgi:asparagine synthase (glutamine-hydrolysing)
MSVIFGKYHINKSPLPKSDLEKMQNRLNHWNADDTGIWKNDFIGLGHLMLWNTPESLHEKLPYVSPYSENVITADARIDNREELFTKLKITDHTVPDSLLILAAYDKYGKDCLQHLIGDFAFAIWDKHKEELFCARDHMGVRPFFYYYDGEDFIWTSEMKGITALKDNLQLNTDYLNHNLAYLDLPLNETPLLGIKEIPPASFFILNKKGIHQQKYWEFDIHYEQPPKKDKVYQEELEYLLVKSVKERLRTGYPVGAQLSGGLDSSAVVAIAHKLITNQSLFYTYSYCLPNELKTNKYPFTDEKEIIKEIASFLGLENSSFLDNIVGDYISVCKKNLDTFEAPMHCPTSEMTSLVTEKATQSGVRILLSGFLGDEGISRRNLSLDKVLISEKRWLDFLQYSLPHILKNPLLNSSRFLKYIQAKSKNSEPLAVKESFLIDKELTLDLIKGITHQRLNRTNVDREEQSNVLKRFYISNRFITENTIAMTSKVEVRYPLASKELLEYFLSLPPQQKTRNGINRYIFREVLKNWLPHDFVMAEKKRSYSIPFLHPFFLEAIPSIQIFFAESQATKYLNIANMNAVYEKIEQTKNISSETNTIHGYDRIKNLVMTLLYLEKNCNFE